MVAQFDQRQGSSAGGAILLVAADRRLGWTAALAACLEDERQRGKIHHAMYELVMQRVMAIACGYEDVRDGLKKEMWVYSLAGGHNGMDCPIPRATASS